MTKNNKAKQTTKAGARLVTRVVVRNVKRKANKMKQKKQKPQYKPRGTDDVSQFHVALKQPFSTIAMGVRVPDSYCFPTVTYHYRSSIPLISDSSGRISLAVFPSPALTLASGNGVVSAGATSFASNNQVFYLVSPTELASKLTEYRTVAWGIRILAKDSAFSTKGKLSIALVPTTNNAPSWNTLQTAGATGTGVATEYIAGFDIGFLDSSILNYPAVKTFSMQDLMREDIEVPGMPLNESFYDFRGTTDRTTTPWSATTNIGDEVATTATALINSTTIGRKDVASVRGGIAILIVASGLPATSQAFDVDIVFHLEGSPNLSSASGAVAGLVPSSQAVLNGSAMTVDKALHEARSGAMIKTTNKGGVGATRAVKFGS